MCSEPVSGARQLLCAEAVVMALSHGLDDGLTDDQAVMPWLPFFMWHWGKRMFVRRFERCGVGHRPRYTALPYPPVCNETDLKPGVKFQA